MSKPLDLRTLLQALVDGGVEFVLVGGLAVNAWGYVRGTRDVDLVPSSESENLERLAAVLDSYEPRIETTEGLVCGDSLRTFLRAGDRTLVLTSLGEVDVLQGLPQVPRYEELERDAVEIDLDGLRISVCSLEHLLRMKRASQRPRDQDDVEALEAARGLDA